MNYIEILGLLFIFYILLNKFLISKKIFLDPKQSLKHKSFLNQSKDVPFSGGILILIACLFFFSIELILFKVFLIIVFLIGFLSDLEILKRPIKRIIFQSFTIGIFLFINDSFINSVRIEFFDSFLEIYYFKLIFTLFCLLILINGSNFMDGINTLTTTYYIMVILSILYLEQKYNFESEINILMISLLSLTIVFIFNLFGKVYLGDSGSYLIAFLVGVILINFSNANIMISPYFVACMLWYPAYENLFSIIRKKIKNISPSKPDNKHLHQLLYLQFKRILKFGSNTTNSITGILINTYNFLVFMFAINNYSNTKILILILIINVIIYTTLYSILKKNYK
jgi:UDP-N-acetylmuramyl pentapeptide phosphotransferase/UDP-N-acetylglucosamine-1-phosphate transferase|tara:strand:+ start:109 stop:1128 length:1020 start_codon:yes stop_codon:yes gene_type:complete